MSKRVIGRWTYHENLEPTDFPYWTKGGPGIMAYVWEEEPECWRWRVMRFRAIHRGGHEASLNTAKSAAEGCMSALSSAIIRRERYERRHGMMTP